MSVSAECAYTANDVVCYVYVDTIDGDASGQQLRSGGVKLTYNADELMGPGSQNPPVATKNVTDWYFGAGSQDAGLEYMDPETGTTGEIVFIVGKMDTTPNFEGGGVSGSRVEIGHVSFTRVNPGLPVADPAATFTIAVELGREAPFANFVNVAAEELDGAITAFNTTVAERWDADAPGFLSSRDLTKLRSLLRDEIYVIYADCSGDGALTSRDLTSLRSALR